MRISNLHIKKKSISAANSQTKKMERVQSQLLTSQKNANPSEDPKAMITSLYHRVRINQIDQYQKNISDTKSFINVEHDKLSSFSEIMRNIRQLNIQAANGPLNNEERINIAVHIEQNLQQLIKMANAQYEDNYIFSGTKTDVKPFLDESNHSNKLGMPITTRVKYLGDGLEIKREIDFDKEFNLSNNGSKIFWAQNHSVVSTTDGQNYIAPTKEKIAIDNYVVEILPGESLSSIVKKINDQVPTAKAFIQELKTGEKTLGLESNFPHQLQIEDRNGGTVLRDLGILKEGARGNEIFDNIKEDAIVHNGSVFDAIIQLRDSIIDDDVENISNRDLGAITQGYKNIIENQSKISAAKWHLDSYSKDLDNERVHSIARKSQVEDANILESIVEYNQLSNVHRLSLQTAARLVRPTLLDYLS